MQVLTRGCEPPVWGKVVVGLKMGSLSGDFLSTFILIVTTGLSLTVFVVLRLVMDRRTDGIGCKMRHFYRLPACQIVELCTETDHWFIQQSIATVHRSKERATIGLCWSEFFVFSF